jgi:hypothetical protein
MTHDGNQTTFMTAAKKSTEQETEFRSIVSSLKNYAGHFTPENIPRIKMLVRRLSDLTAERVSEHEKFQEPVLAIDAVREYLAVTEFVKEQMTPGAGDQ